MHGGHSEAMRSLRVINTGDGRRGEAGAGAGRRRDRREDWAAQAAGEAGGEAGDVAVGARQSGDCREDAAVEVEAPVADARGLVEEARASDALAAETGRRVERAVCGTRADGQADAEHRFKEDDGFDRALEVFGPALQGAAAARRAEMDDDAQQPAQPIQRRRGERVDEVVA